ncbi:oxidoreductase NAD-binding domain-containing protein 1-like [Actinia tenebrosa]|uniref:Oxidoreductase NAD-binding domain-containing protein 1 n=1 Tax=Actinia tenebrosa TaxID=6105 RepID=A0A6P8IMT9_ACTTE|nr:oxidoreductase NAD-binding domain-containing protein 1-like [Actinia tenebrosa]
MMRLLRCKKKLDVLLSRGTRFSHRIMSTHLERTESSSRDQNVFSAEVTKINPLSKSVKQLNLKIIDKSFYFKPGQWVDFFIPGLSTVGGFSICSSPKCLQQNKQLTLAVKYSTHPPAHWVHTQCKTGDKVQIRVGGDFYLDLSKPYGDQSREDILLIAGGVGINPLWSMMQYVADTITESPTVSFGRTSLLYSASTNDELLFKDAIIDTCNQHPLMDCKFFITSDEITDQNQILYNNKFTQGYRITKDTLKMALTQLNTSRVKVFICGPQPMIESMVATLLELGVDINNIHFEKWW